MRLGWLAAMVACVLGLATTCRGHSADVPCPASVMNASSDGIGQMVNMYNLSDIGKSLGRDFGGAAGVEEAISAIRRGSDAAGRSRAIQLLRYALAKHAVSVYREAGSISEVSCLLIGLERLVFIAHIFRRSKSTTHCRSWLAFGLAIRRK